MKQMKTLADKISTLESNSISKNDFSGQIKVPTKEIPAIRNEMISKNDLKVKI